jgi:hypothetical protein
MQIDPPNTTVEPNLTQETVLPTVETNEERTESDEPKAQPSTTQTHQEKISEDEVTVQHESGGEEQKEENTYQEAGTSSTSLNGKGKQ